MDTEETVGSTQISIGEVTKVDRSPHAGTKKWTIKQIWTTEQQPYNQVKQSALRASQKHQSDLLRQ